MKKTSLLGSSIGLMMMMLLKGKSVRIAGENMLKNKPHLVKFDHSVAVLHSICIPF